MATVNSAKRNTSGQFEAAHAKTPRVVDFIVNLGVDATMGTATDDIALGTLAGGTVVLSAALQQITPGTGSGTLVIRSGTTAVTGTLASTAAAGTLGASLPAAMPYTVPVAGEELNLLGATAVRNAGTVRVVLVVVEGDTSPRVPTIVPRDAL
jgi:hypothetical protein